MTLRSVLEIPVNDSAFVRFTDLYNKYQEQLAKQPNVWKKVSQEHNALATNFERMTAALMAQSQLAREQAERERKEESHVTLLERLWTSMSRSTKSVASNITHATSALLKWSSILTGVSGLLGFGGLWGISRMASSISGERRTSMGLGMSVGELQAFRVNFQRLVDPDAFLGRLNEMETNPAKSSPMYVLGVQPTGNTERDAVRLLQAMRYRALTTPENQLGLLSQQTGMDVGAETWRRLHDMSAVEFGKLVAGNAHDVAAFRTSPKTNEAWQDLSTQFQRASTTLFDVFQTRLGKLAPNISRLSEAFVQLGTRLLNSPLIERGIDKIASWMNSFTGEIAKPAFLAAVENLVSSTGRLAQGLGALADTVDELENHPGRAVVHGAARALAWEEKAQGAAADAASKWAKAHGMAWLGGQLATTGQASRETARDLTSWVSNQNETDAVLRHWRQVHQDIFSKRLAALDTKYKFPAGVLEAIWMAESSGSLTPPNSSKGAIGPMQIMPSVAKLYGVDPATLHDPLVSAELGARIFADDLAHYHGEIRKAVAAYNAGSGTIDKAIAAAAKSGRGDSWDRHVLQETRDYLQKVGSRVHLDVHVTTTPGADVAVVASQQVAQ